MKPWDDMTREERIEAVRPLLLKGLSAGKIALRLGAPSRNVIIGLTRRHIPDLQRNDTVPRLWAARQSAQQIATRLPKATEDDAGGRHGRSHRAPPQGNRRGPSPKPPEPTELPPPDPLTGTVAFLDRRYGQCAWPMWDDSSPGRLVCGREADGSSSYCLNHRIRSVGSGTSRERAAEQAALTAVATEGAAT